MSFTSISPIFQFYPYKLKFIKPAKTSRDTLFHKRGFFLSLSSEHFTAWGEVSILESLSIDNVSKIIMLLNNWQRAAKECSDVFDWLNRICIEELNDLPALQTGLEMLKLNTVNGSPFLFFPSDFTQSRISLSTNGLVWMDNYAEMKKQIEAKLTEGFSCIKLKIGALSWDEEYRLLADLRNRFSADLLEIRVDANGAFTDQTVFPVMEQLHRLSIHSIEQPVAVNQWDLMRDVVALRAVPVALDEELIGRHTAEEMSIMLDTIQPDYIILKPSLIGGFAQADRWVDMATQRNIKWWATSALESNLGLTAIAQWAGSRGSGITHGLGTGGLYQQNVRSPLQMLNERLHYVPLQTDNIGDSISPLIDIQGAI